MDSFSFCIYLSLNYQTFPIYKRELNNIKKSSKLKIMNVAIQGCLHGQLDEVYKQLTELQKNLNTKIDLLIICGDFQALRDQTDLQYLHCPPKYKSMGSFFKYLQNQIAPILTIFIGGNHQAVNYMRDLYFGGWVAPNIYYLGQAGSVFVTKGQHKIRVTGMSGIYNHRDFQYILKPQRTPLYGGSKITAYHIKQLEVYRLELLSRITQMKRQEPQKYGREDSMMDCFLSHDWPKNIALYGRTSELYKYKPFLEKQINSGVFGSPPGERLMKVAKPTYWFSAHMHVKYPAIYPHSQKEFTHFLALDKCLQKRSCLQVLTFKSSPSKESQQLSKDNQKVQILLDKVWLTVLNLTQRLQNSGEVLYLFDEKTQQYKLSNSKMMNQMIMKFPTVYQDVFGQKKQQNQNQNQLKPPIFDTINDFSQTYQVLKLSKIQNLKIFEGIIFPKGYFANLNTGTTQKESQQQQNKNHQIQEGQKKVVTVQNVEDEIELDL